MRVSSCVRLRLDVFSDEHPSLFSLPGEGDLSLDHSRGKLLQSSWSPVDLERVCELLRVRVEQYSLFMLQISWSCTKTWSKNFKIKITWRGFSPVAVWTPLDLFFWIQLKSLARTIFNWPRPFCIFPQERIKLQGAPVTYLTAVIIDLRASPDTAATYYIGVSVVLQYIGSIHSLLTLRAASCTASGANTFKVPNRLEIISWSCWKVYGWKATHFCNCIQNLFFYYSNSHLFVVLRPKFIYIYILTRTLHKNRIF